MEFLIGFVRPLCETLVWAGLLYLLGRHASGRFESAIRGAVDRLRKLGPAEFEPTQPQQVIETPKPNGTSQDPTLLLAAPESMLGKVEDPIIKWVETLPPEDRQSALVRALANQQISWHFEVIYNAILGSQIALLQSANSQPQSVTTARLFYDRAAIAFPDYYANHPFENWFGWLVETLALLERRDEGVTITEPGREFLRYLLSRGYSFNRYG